MCSLSVIHCHARLPAIYLKQYSFLFTYWCFIDIISYWLESSEEGKHLVIYQVVKCNDATDQRRKIYNQHHVICFYCRKEKTEMNVNILIENISISIDLTDTSIFNSWRALPAKALINSDTLRFGRRLKTS